MTHPVTPDRFDAALEPKKTAKKEKVWGATEIAEALGVSVDTVYRLAKEPTAPIYRPSGRYFAYRSELDRWLRTKQAA